MSSPRDTARLRLGLNPITTSISQFHAQQATPISAISMASTHAQSVQTPAQTPGSAIQPYNPQQWVTSRPPQQAQYAAENQASPPPPPYSPPRSQQQRPVSTVFDQSPAVSTPTPPVPRLPSAGLHRPSPEPAPNVNFPPPPPVPGGRGASRERRFGLPSLNRRRETEPQPTTPEPRHTIISSRQSMGPVMFHTPEPVRPTLMTDFSPGGPPAARRAMSAGAVETPTSARSRSGSQTRGDWPAGIPPPPPGPPPPNSRSHSVQPIERVHIPAVLSPPTRRPPPSSGSLLGPVPPTPANWADESGDQPVAASDGDQSRPLQIDTELAQQSDEVPEPLQSSGSASGLNRARAVRHDKTIIQRRAESRTRQGGRGSIDEGTRPNAISDIVVPSSSSAPPRPPKTTPLSGGGARTGESSGQPRSSTTTPRVSSAKLPLLNTSIAPFSPARAASASHSIVPKALPTPPPHGQSATSSKAREGSRPPPGPQTPALKNTVVSQNANEFAAGTIERFQAFAASEISAVSDADRVRLFADFIVNESRIRRERYSTAIGAMGSEIFDLTRDLFRPMVPARRESMTSQDGGIPLSAGAPRSRASSFRSITPAEGGPSSAPASGRLPPSPSNGSPAGGGTYNTNYMPSLSPILSMSVSDNYGDGSSRGRPPSRWFDMYSQGEGSQRLERSKRESKYMGVPKTQWVEVEANPSVPATSSEQSSSAEYPPEKTGWHDQPEDNVCTPQPTRFSISPTPMGSSPSPAPGAQDLLDVSRLVTLPPPYPRHHPAVNNSHPELSSIRTSVRALTDLSEVEKVKESFSVDSTKRRDNFTKESAERIQALRANLHQEISSGNLEYADAAAIEADLKSQQDNKKKDLEKSEYEKFQNNVIMPLNELLTGRITRATELYASLSKHLFDDGQMDADMPQEEGDDRPELLEKLTLLKWIFEARETLHRAIFDILSDRNCRYRDVILTPYRLSGNTEKLKNAEAFFADDASKREYNFANEVLNRSRDFRQVMDEAVQRGVALQVAAFWDIAPPLSRLLEKIPMDLGGFHIQIAASEYEENPSYLKHPMQYLLTLLLHTEKSTYQFIEAHTNLLCLLHEAKEAVANAKAKILANQIEEADGTRISPEQREKRSTAMRQSEDRRLTEELKEKVRVVQDQWNSALAQNIASVRERIGEWLLQTDGWDETLIEGEAAVTR